VTFGRTPGLVPAYLLGPTPHPRCGTLPSHAVPHSGFAVINRLQVLAAQQFGQLAGVDPIALVAAFSSAFLRGLQTTRWAT